MILDKIRNRRRHGSGDEHELFVRALTDGPDTPVWDELLAEKYGLTGDPSALFADINSGLRPETRAWFRRGAIKPRPYPRPYPQTPDPVAAPHGEQDGSSSPTTAAGSGQADTSAVAAEPTDRRGSVQ